MLAAGPDGRWTVFLDRDGTINRKAPEGEYVLSADQLVLLDGAAAAISRLRAARARVVVVTNQRGVALGRMTLEDLADVHRELARLLAADGAEVDAVYSCPHGEGSCECRKPEPGLFLRAAEDEPAIDLGSSAMVGDSMTDVEAGARLGMTTVLLADRSSRQDRGDLVPDHVAPTLAEASEWLVANAAEASSAPGRGRGA
jgi:D-glycero-D-manno-heptose 1,7-bisphosphate phosphatase